MNLRLATESKPVDAEFSQYVQERLTEIGHRLLVNKVEKEVLERERDQLRKNCSHSHAVVDVERNTKHCPDCGWSNDF
mgnify:FL=1